MIKKFLMVATLFLTVVLMTGYGGAGSSPAAQKKEGPTKKNLK